MRVDTATARRPGSMPAAKNPLIGAAVAAWRRLTAAASVLAIASCVGGGADVPGDGLAPETGPAASVVTVTVSGHGEVVSVDGQIRCDEVGHSCRLQARRDSEITLQARAAPGYLFDGWRGDCMGADPGASSCLIVVGADTAVTALFARRPQPPATVTAPKRRPADIAEVPSSSTSSGTEADRAADPTRVGPVGEWPWKLERCESAPTVVWGDYEAAPRAPDANGNGIPDVAEKAKRAGRFFWFDPAAPGVGEPARGDPNGNTRGDTLDAAFDALAAAGGGTLGIIGLGQEHPYRLLGFSDKKKTEMSGFVFADLKGDVEICAVNDVAVFSNASGGTLRWTLKNNHDLIVKNIKFDGIELKFQRNSQSRLWWYKNVWMGNTEGKCPQYSDNRNLTDTLLRKAQTVPGIVGGGSWNDPTSFVTIRLENSQFYNCNTNRYSHGFYIETEGCFLHIDNSILESANNLEVWRMLCRAVVIENSRLANSMDWDGTTFGASTIDLRSNSAWVFRNNHVRVVADANTTRYALAVRSRRDNTGSSLPNQWPGPDAASDEYAGNEDWTTHPKLARMLAAKASDAWLHNGYLWNRQFWREVTSSPWRGDQRVLHYSGTGFQIGTTVTGAASGATASLWKADGNELHLILNGATEFVPGEAIVADGANGTVTAQIPVTVRALATNEHLFPKFLSNNIFEAKCLSGRCPGLIPLHSYGSLPGVGMANGNRYFVVPRDSDTDRFPDDGYDTAATPGDGWVERVILFSANNSFVGDWNRFASNQPMLINRAQGPPVTLHDGEHDVQIWKAVASGPPPAPGTPPAAMTPAVAPPTFLMDLGGTAESPAPLPDWWPQGPIGQTCQTLRRRYGNDPDDPLDLHWWDEPGAETGHPRIGHDGFPVHDGFNACPD